MLKRGAFMVGATATATEMQNNFGRYLAIASNGKEVIAAGLTVRNLVLIPALA